MNVYRVIERVYRSNMNGDWIGREDDRIMEFKCYKDAKKEFNFCVNCIEDCNIGIYEPKITTLINNDDRKAYSLYSKNDKEMTIVDIFIIKIKL